MPCDLLDIYTDYLICQNHCATATGLSLLLDKEISHDKITRFLNKKAFDSKDLWEYVKPQICCYEQAQGGVLILENHIFASIMAYCKLEFLKIKTSLNHFATKYKLLVKANQMAFAELKKLRESQ